MNPGASDDPGATLREYAPGQKVFGRYTLRKILGRGGMGIVWLARDEELEREVALKFLPDLVVLDKAMVSELKRETRRSLELTHKNIVRIYDFVQSDSSACISMEYIDGDTLSNLRAEKEAKVFQPNEIATWTGQLCDALDYAHNHARIIHRDLKPANLMVNLKGEMKVSDFGIARRLGDSMSKLTMAQGTSGTLVYMSPQQLDGERGSHLDDIYALGATLYDLLTSKPPFYSGNVDKQVHERIAPSITERRKEFNLEPALVPSVWEETVAACLAKDPAHRPQSAVEVAQRLGLSGSPSGIATAHLGKRSWRPVLVASGIAALLLLIVGGWYLSARWRAPAATKVEAPAAQAAASKSVAVLPFENLSAGEENAVFAGGVHREVLSDLAKIAELKVISRTSVMRYQAGTARNVKDIARELGVAYVVEGSVQRAGERVRVTAQLINARTDTQLWGETYDRQLADVFAIQSEIAQKISKQLGAKLSPQERTAIASRPTEDIKAFEDYIRARALMETSVDNLAYGDNMTKAVGYLEQAVAKDPQFALAYSALAEAKVNRARQSEKGRPEDLVEAKAALEKAHQLAPDAGETHFAQAVYYYWGYFDYDRALASLEVAARALPNSAEIYKLRGLIERRLGRWQESLRHFKQAIELDPKDAEAYQKAGMGAYSLRQYPEGLRILEAAIAALPSEADAFRAQRCVLIGAQSGPEAARSELEKIGRKDTLTAVFMAFCIPFYERNYAEAAQMIENFPRAAAMSYQRASFAVASDTVEQRRASFQATLAGYEEELAKPSPEPWILGDCALLQAALGNKAEAIRIARRGVELYSVNKNAVDGTNQLKNLALVYTWTGEKAAALELLSDLVKMPNALEATELALDPGWDNLRDDPRFADLVAESAKPIE